MAKKKDSLFNWQKNNGKPPRPGRNKQPHGKSVMVVDAHGRRHMVKPQKGDPS